jgi:tRNA (mo5U34)-methyltransferase
MDDSHEDAELTPEQIQKAVDALGPWFHNLDLNGVRTAPNHFLGDYPTFKWRGFQDSIDADLRGQTVLDVGCNAGFYCFEMKRRGAERVLGIDSDEGYLAQARFAARLQHLDVEFRNLSVYEVERLGEKFDWVLFLGVFYHLRYPLLALDLLREYVVRNKFVFQSMQRGSRVSEPIEADYPFSETALFDRSSFPKLHFVEHSYANDPTNWWIPNRACSEAMLRSAGFRLVSNPEREVLVCELGEREVDLTSERSVIGPHARAHALPPERTGAGGSRR